MRGLDPTHASVDDYQLETRDLGMNETVLAADTRKFYTNRMPPKSVFGYGDQAITLEEWKAVYGGG
jgi:hypothetical protein